MKAIKIIDATEQTKLLGFYQGEHYIFRLDVTNERGENISLFSLLDTGATIRLVEL